MKLLMITGLGSAKDLVSDKRGAFYYMLEEFSKYWDRIDIISPRARGVDSGVKVIFGNVFIHISPWPLVLHPFWFLKKGLEIYKEQKFDIMTVQEFPPFYNGIGAKLLWNKIHVPYILEIHHIPGYPKAASFKERLYGFFMRCFIKYDAFTAKVVRVVNQHQVPEFLIQAGVSKEKIVYIPSLYIDLETFQPLSVEKKYDLVFTARLEKNKGIHLLLRAIKNVKLQNPNVKLLIIGSGPLKGEIQKYIRGYKLENNVFLSGWLETLGYVAQAYNSASIFINPSFNEGGPRVVLEAMACGLPVITTPVGAMPDIIKDGESGLFIDWNPADMAQKIWLLLNNVELQKKFSLAGIELVKQFERKSAIKNYAEKTRSFINK